MFITLYIIPPLVGGVIGYVTNDIAIRMLFRPHTAKHIMGWRVPFTPGIIPKEKGRIAEAVGTAISDNLMSKEVLEKYLLSDNMVGRVRSSMEEFIAKLKDNEESVSQFLEHYLSHAELMTWRRHSFRDRRTDGRIWNGSQTALNRKCHHQVPRLVA